ncbi:MAG: L,D-transpeptidase family protein [Armatimonadota bacterium]
MIAAEADGARGWFGELLQVALAFAGVWVALAALDIAMYERLANDRQAVSAAPLACVISAPFAERVRAGRLEAPPAAPVADEVPSGAGELATALAQVKAETGGLAGGVREDDVFYVDVASVAELINAELRQASSGAPARLISPSGIVEVLPFSRTVRRNFQPTDLPHPTRVINASLHLPVRGLETVLPIDATWDEETRAWTLASGDRRMRVAVAEDLFEITIDRSDRILTVHYAGRQLVRWLCCTGKGNNSPIGQWRVQNKAVWPAWISYEGNYIPGGNPRNPLGARWLGTTARGHATGRTIGIHGTNQPSSIGRRISGGCIRLTNAHAIEMYNTIPIGARVIIKE